ncbi:response regulator [Spirosoma aerophilum]
MKSLTSECVFLVDDDEDDRFLVQAAFEQNSPECRVKPIPNGVELLQALKTSVDFPRLILLDLNMPLMGGLEVLQKMRQESGYDTIPVVILTTSNQSADRQAAIALKADGFITKPSTLDGLNQVVLGLRQAWLSGKCVIEQPREN